MNLWSPRAHNGFTLVELMIVVAILGVLIGVVAPNYSVLVARVQVATETKRLISILKQARSEAKFRGATVTVSRGANDDWTRELLVYESTTSAGNIQYQAPLPTATTGDDLISEHAASSAAVTIRDDAVVDGEYISFSMQGWLSSGEQRNVVFAICSPALSTRDGVYIEVNRVGKIRERAIGNDVRGCL